MKKFLFSFLLFSPIIIYGLPVGNPSDASLYYHEPTCDGCGRYYDVLSLGFGYYGDYVFNRHLETNQDRDIEKTQLYTNAAYLVVSFFEHIDIFGTLGASTLFLNTNFVAFNPIDPEPRFDLDSTTAFSWSIGERITLCRLGQATLGIEGQYFETRPHIQRVYIAAGASAYLDGESHSRYQEWQAGLGLSYRLKDILPYAAVKWSHAKWIFGNRPYIIGENTGTTLFNLRNQRSWGYALGATISPLDCDRIAVTLEGRFGDEKAFYVNGQMRF